MKTILLILILGTASLCAVAQTSTTDSSQTLPDNISVEHARWAPLYLRSLSSFNLAPALVGSVNRSSGRHPNPDTNRNLNHNVPSNRATHLPATNNLESSLKTSPADSPWRQVSVVLTNKGAIAIKSVRFDFVFTDRVTGAEVLRIDAHSKKRIKPGRSHDFAKQMKATKKNRKADDAKLLVELKEIKYSDGSIWRP